MRRRILALSAAALLLAAVIIAYGWPHEELALAFCWRGGAILAAAWLAFDDVQRIPNWLVIAFPILLLILVRSPRVLWVLLPLFVGIWAVRRLLTPRHTQSRN